MKDKIYNLLREISAEISRKGMSGVIYEANLIYDLLDNTDTYLMTEFVTFASDDLSMDSEFAVKTIDNLGTFADFESAKKYLDDFVVAKLSGQMNEMFAAMVSTSRDSFTLPDVDEHINFGFKEKTRSMTRTFRVKWDKSNKLALFFNRDGNVENLYNKTLLPEDLLNLLFREGSASRFETKECDIYSAELSYSLGSLKSMSDEDLFNYFTIHLMSNTGSGMIYNIKFKRTSTRIYVSYTQFNAARTIRDYTPSERIFNKVVFANELGLTPVFETTINEETRRPEFFKEPEIVKCDFTGRDIYVHENEFLMKYVYGRLEDKYQRTIFNQSDHKQTTVIVDGKYVHYTYLKDLKLAELGFEIIPRVEALELGFDGPICTFNKEKTKENAIVSAVRGYSTLRTMSRVQGYSFKWENVPFVRHENDSKDEEMFFGVEFEFDDGGSGHDNAAKVLAAFTDHNPIMYATTDSSINNGFEVKTVPMTYASLRDESVINFKRGMEVLEHLGYTGENDTCGLHIHTSKQYYHDEVSKALLNSKVPIKYMENLKHLPLLIMTSILKHNWEEVITFTRRNEGNINEWAPIRYSFTESEVSNVGKLFSSDKSVSDILNKLNRLSSSNLDNSSTHYSAISAATKQPTLEFRIFRGTTDPLVAIASIQFTDNMAKFAVNATKDLIGKIDKALETPKDEDLIKMLIDTYVGYVTTDIKDIYNYNGSYVEILDYVENL